jgi:hypothetical protein
MHILPRCSFHAIGGSSRAIRYRGGRVAGPDYHYKRYLHAFSCTFVPFIRVVRINMVV